MLLALIRMVEGLKNVLAPSYTRKFCYYLNEATRAAKQYCASVIIRISMTENTAEAEYYGLD